MIIVTVAEDMERVVSVFPFPRKIRKAVDKGEEKVVLSKMKNFCL